MISYRDRSYCSMKNCPNKECSRNITEEVDKQATKWWGSPNYPICVVDFTDCENYTKDEKLLDKTD